MAIIPVHQMIQTPDLPNAWLNGQAAGMKLKAAREAQADDQRLRELTPNILAGDTGAYDAAVAIDPERATAVQTAGDSKLRRLRGFVSYIDAARASGNPAQLNAALREVGPYVSREFMGGRPLPTEWTPDMDAGWETLKARVAGAESSPNAAGVQSTYVDGDGNRVAIMRDGSTQILGQNDAGMSQQTINVTGPDGRPAQYTFDKRTGSYVPAALGGQGPQAQGATQAPPGVYIDPSLPPEVQAQIAQAEASGQQVPAQMYFGAGQGGDSPFVGRRAEDEAAAKRAAEIGVDLAYADTRAQADARAAGQRETAVQSAKSAADRQAGRGKARLSLDQATARLGRVDALVDSIMPRIGALTAGWAGNALSNIPGTSASDLRKDIGTLQAIAGFDELSAMRAASPTGGALGNVTERELAFLQSVVRNIENSQSPEQLRRNLQEFQREVRGSWQRVRDAYEQDYGGQYGPAPADGPAQPDANSRRRALLDKY